MDFKEIKRLVALVEGAQISHLSIEEDGVKIEVKKESPSTAHTTVVAQPQPVVQAPSEPVALPTDTAAPEPGSSDNLNGLIPIKAPTVGTFYSAANPESPPFVKVGDSVSTGQTVCIVEAMKLFNEIESDISGTIEKVLVETGAPVEYGQSLFLVRPA